MRNYQPCIFRLNVLVDLDCGVLAILTFVIAGARGISQSGNQNNKSKPLNFYSNFGSIATRCCRAA